MLKPDCLVSWPRNADYPLWRQMIRDNRDKLNEVIVVFTETWQGSDYRDFVRQAMFQDHVLFVQSPTVEGNEDWRNVAVNFGLQQSLHSEWIWFTEQDFFPSPLFWSNIEEMAKTNDVIATFDAMRMHPCNILIRRTTLFEKTKRNFGIVRDELDHFGLIQKQLVASGAKIYKQSGTLGYHMNGLSHNWRLISEGLAANWEKQDFLLYLNDCLKVTVPLDGRFIRIASAYLEKNKDLVADFL